MKKFLELIGLATLVFIFSNQLYAQDATFLEVPIARNGEMLSLAGIGGLNAPQVSQIDWNRDGIEDLLIFDRVGHVSIPLVKQSANPGLDYRYAPQYRQGLPDFRFWALAVDYNKDGIDDIFTAASPFGIPGIAVYKGVENGDRIEFEKQTFNGKSYLQVPAGNGLTNLYVSWEDIPTFDDVDSDGDLDILSFDPGGSRITLYNNLSVENGWSLDSLQFEIGDACWGKILESEVNESLFLSDDPNDCSDGNLNGDIVVTPRHAGSTLCSFDQDGDGLYDILIGDITSGAMVFGKNGGTNTNGWITEQDATWPFYDEAVQLEFFPAAFHLDVDHDGLEDILVGSNTRSFGKTIEVLWFYKNIGTSDNATFELQQKDLFVDKMLDFGSETNPAFADVNADGLMDILIGSFESEVSTFDRIPKLKLLTNEGTTDAPSFIVTDEDYLGMSTYFTQFTYNFAPSFGDLDGDGDQDLVIGDFKGKLFYYENTAGANNPFNFAQVRYPYFDIDVGASAAPIIFDIDGDGLNDLLIGEQNANFDDDGNCGSITFYKNIGSTGSPQFMIDANSPNTECYGQVKVHEIPGIPIYSKPRILFDNGNQLLLVGGDEYDIQEYEVNTSDIYAPFLRTSDQFGGIKEGKRPSFDLVDLNNDNFYEMVVGNVRGGIAFYSTDVSSSSLNAGSGIDLDRGILLLPNPTNAEFSIRKDLNISLRELIIYDIQGRKLAQITNPEGQSINVSNYSSGTYLVRLILVDGQEVVKKMVKI